MNSQLNFKKFRSWKIWLLPTWLCSLCINIWDEVSKALKRNVGKGLRTSLLKLELVCECVLVSSKTDIIFSMVADMILYVGFRTKAMLITQWCFSCCWAVVTYSQGHSYFSWCPSSGVHKGQGEEKTRTVDRNQTKGYSIPFGVMLKNKTGGAV